MPFHSNIPVGTSRTPSPTEESEQDVKDAVPYKISGVLRKDIIPYKNIKHFSINLRIIGRIEPTNPELLNIFDRKFQNPYRFSNTPLHSVSKNPFIMIKSNEK